MARSVRYYSGATDAILVNMLGNPIGENGLAVLRLMLQDRQLATICGIANDAKYSALDLSHGRGNRGHGARALTPMDVRMVAADLHFGANAAGITSVDLSGNRFGCDAFVQLQPDCRHGLCVSDHGIDQGLYTVHAGQKAMITGCRAGPAGSKGVGPYEKRYGEEDIVHDTYLLKLVKGQSVLREGSNLAVEGATLVMQAKEAEQALAEAKEHAHASSTDEHLDVVVQSDSDQKRKTTKNAVEELR